MISLETRASHSYISVIAISNLDRSMSNNHLETPDFPLHSSGEVDGPAHRQAHEIGCGALVIRSTEDGHTVCLKLDRIGKEYIHHYVVVLDPKPQGEMELVYVDPEEHLFDCFATMELELGSAEDVAVEIGHVLENKDGHFIKLLDDPKTQKMFCFAEPATGLVRIRQERKLKSVHPNWKARAKLKDDVVELSHLLEHFAEEL